MRLAVLFMILWAGAATAGPIPDAAWDAMRRADVVVLGEVHDNPGHHARQAEIVTSLQPAALVVEMLTPDQAGRLRDVLAGDPALAADRLGWRAAGWPDFEMYRPIFTGAGEARVYGAALPRAEARRALETGIADFFGAEAVAYGLDRDLPPGEQAAREALQSEVHCGALPDELLPGMVALQRLRDAMLARAVVQAVSETGGPVQVITGNGHARADWGLPRFLARAQPGLMVFVVGQSEDAVPPDGVFDLVLDAAAVERPDPCAAFR